MTSKEHIATNISSDDLSWQDLKTILDNSFDEIYVIDGNGIIIYVNNVSYLHYGVGPETLIGKSYLYLEKYNYCAPPLVPIVMENKRILTMEQTTKTGKIITVTANPVLNDDGTVKMIVMNSRDISAINHLKEMVEQNKSDKERYKTALLQNQSQPVSYGSFIGESKSMRQCFFIINRVSKFNTTVLLFGETGVGKSVMARYIHNTSTRKDEPFITINCAAIPRDLLESELFGYCKGAFSGANSGGKMGLAFLAHKGTLFLDEIGELPITLQAKILQLVQDHSFIPVGDTKEVKVDIRIIAATNQDLKKCVENGTFRSDLYYRLEIIKIKIPPLRERKEDLFSFIDLFLRKMNKKYKTKISFSASAMERMVNYVWPGNIREMEHTIERLVLISQNEQIEEHDLPQEFFYDQKGVSVQQKHQKHQNPLPHIPTKEEEIETVIRCYLEEKSTYKVAEKLKMSQSKVARIIKQQRDQ